MIAFCHQTKTLINFYKLQIDATMNVIDEFQLSEYLNYLYMIGYTSVCKINVVYNIELLFIIILWAY